MKLNPDYSLNPINPIKVIPRKKTNQQLPVFPEQTGSTFTNEDDFIGLRPIKDQVLLQFSPNLY